MEEVATQLFQLVTSIAGYLRNARNRFSAIAYSLPKIHEAGE